MNNVNEIIERMKDFISIKHGNKKVYDKDIAQYLKICPKKLSSYKKTNKVPYEELLFFCHREEITFESIVMKEKLLSHS